MIAPPHERPRGRLKIFFGYAPGASTAEAMREAARSRAERGEDVVAGRAGPGLEGLESLPRRASAFDLAAALERRPAILLLEDLAAVNPSGSRHVRRWQDVQELLEAGIDVWTTLSVERIESLRDLVAPIAGTGVQDTVPDTLFDSADEVEFVDLAPDDLLSRGSLRDPALPGKANLIALREIALRRAADRIQAGRRRKTGSGWRTEERLLVCVGPSPTSARILRSARRMAAAMHAPWIALHVSTASRSRNAAGTERIRRHLDLARELGAEATVVEGPDVAEVIVERARAANATKIVIGKTGHSSWLSPWRRSVVDRVLDRSGDVDVYVIRGHDEPPPAPAPVRKTRDRVAGYLAAAGALAAATIVASAFDAFGLGEPNLVMPYFLGLIYVAARHGLGPAVFTSSAAVLLFNFFFTEPRHTFVVDDTGYFFTFGVMLVSGLLAGALTARGRAESQAAAARERRMETFYELSRALSGTTGNRQLVVVAESHLAEVVQGRVAVLLPGPDGALGPSGGRSASWPWEEADRAAASWAYERGRIAGAGTETFPEAKALYFPLPLAGERVGVIGILAADLDRLHLPDQQRLLENLAGQIALALERDRLAEEAHRVLAQVEGEKVRSALLSSVSHDLRTPLAVIAGSAESLLAAGGFPGAPDRSALLQSIAEEAHRISRMVESILTLTRIESGGFHPVREWHVFEEIVGSALHRTATSLAHHEVWTRIPDDLPLVSMDGVLIEQVLVNLLENAAAYCPPGTPVEIAAQALDRSLVVEVSDRGPGLAAGEEERVFEKFYRGEHGRAAGARRGAGLGLSICQAILAAHGGSIEAARRQGGGSAFRFRIPIEGEPPEISGEPALNEGAGAP